MKFLKRINRILFVSALILSAGACTRVDEELLGATGSDGDVVELTVKYPSTRTAINGLNPVWRAGDEIWLSDGTNDATAVVPREYDGKDCAKLTVSGLDSGSPIYAVYPAHDSLRVNNEKILASIPTWQDGSFGKAHLAVGICPAGGDREISFKNACAILKFDISREDLRTMQLQNTSIAFSGQFKIDPATGGKSDTAEVFRRIRMDFIGVGDKYISVMEGNLPKGAKFTFVSKDGRMGYIYTSQKNALENGYIYDLGSIDDKITMDGSPATDISETESANCYIINGGGSYRFKAVRGNSDKALENIAFADVVWETTNKTTAPTRFSMASEVAYSDGYIYVRVPDNVPDGNMLISACDEYGMAIWSWHIWILKDGITDQIWPSGATMMDRNLGALSATPGNVLANGLIYEWGRKDPFMGIGKANASTSMAVAGTTTTVTGTTDENGTVEFATSHPTVYLYKSDSDWLDSPDPALWSASKKTEYDPCPPGYHVPYESVFSGLSAENSVYLENEYGRKVTYEGQDIWFPFNGRRQSGTGGLNLGYNNKPLLYLYYDENTSSTGSCSWIGSETKFEIGSGTYQKSHSSGFGMRCQKIVKSGITNTVKLKYKVEDVSFGVKAPSFQGDSYGERLIDWGDGNSEGLDLDPYVFHYYNAPGTYSIIVTISDIKTITIPLGDIEEIDVKDF